ncbi:sensor histidine kinase [Streptomyces sp. CRN 30]|uniref:sensor histidine kinase n=1 Tax=Streptomyces sp. CRN 30 TaxID=3075613 RepID=UPI002A8391FA|nr:histidine kinase [Streptomyces sp. CRN 30]
MKARLPLTASVTDTAVIVASMLDVCVHVDFEDRTPVVCALLAVVVLPFRRRLPLPTFLLALPATLVTDAVFATLAALYTLASLTRRRSLLAACALAYAACDITAWSWPEPRFADLSDPFDLVMVTYSLATAAAPVFLEQLVQARRELALRLSEISVVRESGRQLRAQNVLARERAQLAREMHDVVSHQVSLIAVRAGALQVAGRDAETRQAGATIRLLSVETLDELRHMVGVLRASGGRPSELTPQPSLAELPRLVEGSGIDAELRTDLPANLPPNVQRTVYRTVQEALTNVRKHAPGTTAAISVGVVDGTVRVTVTNSAPDQPALPLPGAHHGLVGLRQRAELLGGHVGSGPTPDGGWRLTLDLPAAGGTA